MPQNGTGQRLIEQRQHWLFKGFDLGHLLTLFTIVVGAVWVASDLKTDIAVLKTQQLRVAEDVRELQVDLRQMQRSPQPWRPDNGRP